jgi:hypothetical protein
VNLARHHFLADAAFASNQDLGIGTGRLTQFVLDVLHGSADDNDARIFDFFSNHGMWDGYSADAS